jgi:hypothetical protein
MMPNQRGECKREVVLWIVAGDEVVEVSAGREPALRREAPSLRVCLGKPGKFEGVERALVNLISTTLLPLRADAPPVYLAAARFFEGDVFVGAQVVNRER